MQRTRDPLLLVLLFSLEAKFLRTCRFDVLSGLETGSCMMAAKSALWVGLELVSPLHQMVPLHRLDALQAATFQQIMH